MMNSLQMTKAALLDGEENVVSSRKTGRNTAILTLADGTEICKYVSTHVSTKRPDGTIVLQSGGYRSQTTKKRIHEHTGIGISQNKGIWYMPDGSLFYDGIVCKDGKTVSEVQTQDKARDKRIHKMKKRIADYVKLITPSNCPLPNPGDCMLCSMIDATTGKTLGDATENTDHLLSHLDEGYVNGSLLVNATREQGIGLHILQTPSLGLWHVHKAVTRYLTRRLLPEVAPA